MNTAARPDEVGQLPLHREKSAWIGGDRV